MRGCPDKKRDQLSLTYLRATREIMKPRFSVTRIGWFFSKTQWPMNCKIQPAKKRRRPRRGLMKNKGIERAIMGTPII